MIPLVVVHVHTQKSYTTLRIQSPSPPQVGMNPVPCTPQVSSVSPSASHPDHPSHVPERPVRSKVKYNHPSSAFGHTSTELSDSSPLRPARSTFSVSSSAPFAPRLVRRVAAAIPVALATLARATLERLAAAPLRFEREARTFSSSLSVSLPSLSEDGGWRR